MDLAGALFELGAAAGGFIESEHSANTFAGFNHSQELGSFFLIKRECWGVYLHQPTVAAIIRAGRTEARKVIQQLRT